MCDLVQDCECWCSVQNEVACQGMHARPPWPDVCYTDVPLIVQLFQLVCQLSRNFQIFFSYFSSLEIFFGNIKECCRVFLLLSKRCQQQSFYSVSLIFFFSYVICQAHPCYIRLLRFPAIRLRWPVTVFLVHSFPFMWPWP